MKVKETRHYKFELHENINEKDTDTLIVYSKSKSVFEKDSIKQVRSGVIAKKIFEIIDGNITEE